MPPSSQSGVWKALSYTVSCHWLLPPKMPSPAKPLESRWLPGGCAPQSGRSTARGRRGEVAFPPLLVVAVHAAPEQVQHLGVRALPLDDEMGRRAGELPGQRDAEVDGRPLRHRANRVPVLPAAGIKHCAAPTFLALKFTGLLQCPSHRKSAAPPRFQRPRLALRFSEGG